jgi:hypothetical protein
LIDGSDKGVIKVATARGFKVKASVVVKSSTQQPVTLEIKSIPDSETIEVGPAGASIDERSNLSSFLVADLASISQGRQKRPSIGPGEIDRATYEEEPAVARRSVLVDEFGNKFAADNPFPVQLSDGSINIGTVNAELEVALSHKDDTPHQGDVADSVRIGDGVNEAQVDSRNRLRVHDEDILLQLRTSAIVNQSSFLKLSNYDRVAPTFREDGVDIFYYEDDALIGKSTINYTTAPNWEVILEAYVNDDDGSLLLDDDDIPLSLE